METAELFKKVVLNYLSGQPRGAQKKLAEESGVEYKYLNGFLNGYRSIGEKERVKVSSAMRMTYLEALNLGHKLETGKDLTMSDTSFSVSPQSLSKRIQDLSQQDLKLVNDMVIRLSQK